MRILWGSGEEFHFWTEQDVFYFLLELLLGVDYCHTSLLLGLPVVALLLAFFFKFREQALFLPVAILDPRCHVVSCSLVDLTQLRLLGDFSDALNGRWHFPRICKRPLFKDISRSLLLFLCISDRLILLHQAWDGGRVNKLREIFTTRYVSMFYHLFEDVFNSIWHVIAIFEEVN